MAETQIHLLLIQFFPAYQQSYMLGTNGLKTISELLSPTL